MDNASIHKSRLSQKIFTALEIEVWMLPSYTPEFAPVELMFRALKAKLRKRISGRKVDFSKASGIKLISASLEELTFGSWKKSWAQVIQIMNDSIKSYKVQFDLSPNIFLNSELLQNVDDLVNNKFKKSEGFKFSKAKLKRKKFTKASAFSKGSSFAMKSKDLKPFNFNKSLSNFSHEGSTNSEAEAENSRISSSEVIKIIEKLYEKLVACLDNALMRQRFENSFKSNSTESTKKVNKSRQDIFKAKMAIIKTIKRSTQALFMKYSIRERAMKHFFKNLRNLVEKESKDMKVDASRNIKVIFKDILDGDSFNLKKLRNYSEEAKGLIGIEEVSSISSNDERSLTKNKSYHTLYSDDQESHTSQSANKRNSFQNEQIRMLAGLKPTTTIVKTQPAEVQ